MAAVIVLGSVGLGMRTGRPRPNTETPELQQP